MEEKEGRGGGGMEEEARGKPIGSQV